MKQIMKKDFPRLSSSDSVELAVEAMEKMNVAYLLVEEGKSRGVVTSRGLAGYPASRLILDCLIEPIGTISGEASPDEALKVLEGEKVNFLMVFNGEAKPIGIINREIIISALCHELRKSNEEKEEHINERKRAEEQLQKAYQELTDTHVQLVQAGKLAAMGEMAAGIVHELTQPLLGIQGFATALLEDAKSDLQTKAPGVSDSTAWKERTAADIEVILEQAERMMRIVNTVRDFARASGTQMALLDINAPIEDALLLFSEQLRLHNIVVEKNLAQGLPKVMGNANQLQQVFINLITNARDAINAKAGEGRLMISTRESSYGIHIEVEDTGIGADTEIAGRMFDPFFTTEAKGQGLGLGLSIVARIIKEHEGAINVWSEPGRGCRFTIRLPLAVGGKDGENG